MTKEEKIEFSKGVYDKFDLRDYSLNISRDDEINADYIWVSDMRGPGSLIIDDSGEYLYCPSSYSYEQCKEDFKKGTRSKRGE